MIKQKSFVFSLLLLFFLLSFSWIWSIGQREPHRALMTGWRAELVTTELATYAQNWSQNGASNERFAMVYRPKSLAFPTLESRGERYFSYPPGAVALLYASGGLLQAEPNVHLATRMMTVFQWIIALALSGSVFILLYSRLRWRWVASIAALWPGLLVILLPGPSFMFTEYYVFDTVVLLWLSLVILTECLSMEFGRKPAIVFLQNLVLLFAFLTDWLSVFFFVPLLLFRWWDRRRKPSDSQISGALDLKVSFVAPALGALIFGFWLAINHVGEQSLFSSLASRFRYRANVGDLQIPFSEIFDRFWNQYIQLAFFTLGKYLLIFTAVWLLYRLVLRLICALRILPPSSITDLGPRIDRLSVLICLPLFLHTFIFKQHGYFHEFSGLKFLFVIAVIPLSLAAPLALDAAQKIFSSSSLIKSRWQKRSSIVVFALISVWIFASARFVYQGYRSHLNHFPPADKARVNLAKEMSRLFLDQDVLLSPDLELNHLSIEANLSGKFIDKIDSMEQVKLRSQSISSPHQIVLVFKDPPTESWMDHLKSTAFFRVGPWIAFRLPQ